MTFARSLATVSSLTVVSRVGGFVRDTLTAMFLGAGPMADAYFVAQRFPNLFRSLFAEGAFSAAFVPLYTTEQERNGTEAAQNFAGQSLAVLMAALIPFSAIIMLLMPHVMLALAPGFEKDPEKFDLAVNFSLITFPYLTLISITSLQSGILNARGIFGPGAAAPISFNIVLVIALFIAKAFHFHMGFALSWAVTFAGIVQMVWLMISCHRAGVPIPLVWPRMTKAAMQLFKRIGPGALGAGASQVNLLVSTILASLLPTGAVSWLFYADRLNQLPLGVVGVAVGTTLLPMLARHVEAGREDSVRHYNSRAIEFCLLLGLPATIGLTIAAKPIVQTLFQHGAFSAADAAATAQSLAAYAIGIPAVLLVKVFSAGFFARHDTKTPVKIALIAMTVNVLASILLIGPLQHIGIALANSIAVWVNAALLFMRLRKKNGGVADDKLRRNAPRLALCAVGMSAATWGSVALTDTWLAHDFAGQLAALAFIIVGSSLVYALTLQLSGTMKLQDIMKVIKRQSEI